MYYYGFIKKLNPYSGSSLQGEGVCVLGCLGVLVGGSVCLVFGFYHAVHLNL